ncbi:MAG: hypothetical protein DME55_03540 [Verrucomicrobia bacterium]|nr:MAG: hypothetical protein DME55_03540 [Verrucomicrobiota bacterium]
MDFAPNDLGVRRVLASLSLSRVNGFEVVKSKTRSPHVSYNMTSLAIEELPAVIKEDVEDFLENHPRSPAARLRPRMGMVGDIWLAFIGPEVRRGASGLGETPRDALKDFNQHFMEPLISQNGSEPHDTD